jgi:Tfp pilus assembly protein PilP
VAKKKKQSIKKKLFIIAGSLLAFQAALIIYFQFLNPAPTTKESIKQAVEKTKGISADRKKIIQLQLAIAQYQSKNQGKLPNSLKQLVPQYIDSIPTGSDGSPIKYIVEGKNFKLEDPSINSVSLATDQNKLKDLIISDEAKQKLVESLDQAADANRPIYDPSGKRDPFKPVNLSPSDDIRKNLTPLENYPLEKLSYSAFIQTTSNPKAILENSEGRGYTVTTGDKVGPNSGTITEITPEKIVVVESITDLNGKITAKTFEYLIGVKGLKGQKRS